MKAFAAIMARLHAALASIHLSASNWHHRRAVYWRRIWRGER